MKPPRLADWLLLRLLPEEISEAVLGDLHEVFAEEVASPARQRRARWRYWHAAVVAVLAMTPVDALRPIPPPGYRRQGGIFPNLNSDVRHGLKQLWRSPMFTGVSVLLLALGIAVNALIFSFVDTRLRSPVPGTHESQGLVSPAAKMEGIGLVRTVVGHSADELRALAEANPVLLSLGGESGGEIIAIDGNDEVTSVLVKPVTGNYFTTVRPRMVLGRGISTADDAAAHPVAIISESFWREVLHADRGVIGGLIHLNRQPFTVIGITARAFAPSHRVWIPASAIPLTRALPDSAPVSPLRFTTVYGRLRPGAVLPPAPRPTRPLGEMDAAAIGALYPAGIPPRALARDILPVRALGLLVLAIAGTNVSLLLLCRGMARSRELAVRLALGASRDRVVRLLLVENLLLGLPAGAGGLLLAAGVAAYVNRRWPQLIADLAISWHAALATAFLTMVTMLAIGLLPALHATATSIAATIKHGTAGGRLRHRMQRIFVVIEVALSTGLGCAAGLLVPTVFMPLMTPPGYAIGAGTLTGVVAFRGGATSPVRIESLVDDITARLGALPGIAGIGFSTVPLGAPRDPDAVIHVGTTITAASGNRVSAGFFAAAGIPLLAGRDVTPGDRGGAEPVIWIDDVLARQHWRGASPIGHALAVDEISWNNARGRPDTTRRSYRVAGVVGRVRGGVSRDQGDLYSPLSPVDSADALDRPSALTLVVRTMGEGAPSRAAIMEALQPLRSMLIIMPLQSAAAAARRVYDPIVAVGILGALVAGVALLMACVGVYAIIASGVSSRTREIGIRLALGARRWQVLRLFFVEGFRLALVGMVIGVPATLAMFRLVGDRTINDLLLRPATVAAVVGLLLVVIGGACWLPTRRASRVDPAAVIRGD